MIIKFVHLIKSLVTDAFRMPVFYDYRNSYNYEQYWKTREITVDMPKRFRLISGMIDKNSSILDLGCGDGKLLKYLKDNNGPVELTGCDISDEAVSRAKSKGIACYQQDLLKGDFRVNGSYDYIVLSEVIEHIAEPEVVLNKIKDSFRKKLFISIPNTAYIAYRLRLLLLGRFPIQWNLHPKEHLRFWTVPDFYDWAASLNYRIEKIVPSDGIPFFAYLWPNLFSSQFIAVLTKQ